METLGRRFLMRILHTPRPLVLPAALVIAIHPRVAEAQDPCAGFKKVIENLQDQAQLARDALDGDTCAGAARILCTKRIQAIGEQIQAETKSLRECENPQPSMAQGSFQPRYYLLTILYAPPGNQSEAIYASGSSVGSRSEVTTTNQGGFQLQATSSFVEVDFGFQIGSKDGHSLETKKETTHTLSLQSQIDQITHHKDMFYIWTNPELDFQQTAKNAATISLKARENQSITIVNLTAEELQDPTKIPAAKQQALMALKPEDYPAILAFDPYVTGAPINPSRFVKISTLQVDGPDQPGDPISGQGIKLSTEAIAGTISSQLDKINLTVLVGGEVSFIWRGGFKVGGSYEWDYENTTEQTTGSTQEIEVTLRSTTVGYHDVVDVYYDTVFQSFSYVSRIGHALRAETAVLSGVIRDQTRKPAMNERVIVTLADGTKRIVITNARGIYRVFDVENATASAAMLEYGGQRHRITLEAGKPTVLNLQKP
jgi:hypothetical protein